MSGHEADYDMVMPFVVVESQGGPYEDTAFVAGYELGLLDAFLERQPASGAQYTLRADSFPQVDLLAMRYGYKAHPEPPDGDDGWQVVTFSRALP